MLKGKWVIKKLWKVVVGGLNSLCVIDEVEEGYV